MRKGIKLVECSICGTTKKVMPEVEKEPICQTCFREVKTQQPRGRRLGASRTFDEIEEELQLPGRLLEIKVDHWRETVEIITEINKEPTRQAEALERKVADDKVLEEYFDPLVGFWTLEQDESGNTYFKGVIETCLATDELKSKVEQLKMLREIEKEARLNAEALKQQFEKDPLLLKVYLSSAEYVMEKVGKAIDDLIGGLL